MTTDQKTVTLALRLKDEKTKKVHAVLEKSFGIVSGEEIEEDVKPFTCFIKGLISEVNRICEQQGLRICNADSLEQRLLINVLLSLAKEELKDFSFDISVLEIVKSEKTKEEKK